MTFSKEHSQQALAAWLSVVKAYNLCDTVLEKELTNIGLSTAQYEVLTQLYRSPGLSQQQLAERCFFAKSGISMLIKKMEDLLWVKRSVDPNDSRARLLTLTAAGMAQAKKSIGVQAKVVELMAKPMSRTELTALKSVMDRSIARMTGHLETADLELNSRSR